MVKDANGNGSENKPFVYPECKPMCLENGGNNGNGGIIGQRYQIDGICYEVISDCNIECLDNAPLHIKKGHLKIVDCPGFCFLFFVFCFLFFVGSALFW